MPPTSSPASTRGFFSLTPPIRCPSVTSVRYLMFELSITVSYFLLEFFLLLGLKFDNSWMVSSTGNWKMIDQGENFLFFYKLCWYIYKKYISWSFYFYLFIYTLKNNWAWGYSLLPALDRFFEHRCIIILNVLFDSPNWWFLGYYYYYYYFQFHSL